MRSTIRHDDIRTNIKQRKECRFAMKIGGYYKDSQIQQRHIEKMARACEFSTKEAQQILSKMGDSIPEAAQKVANEMSSQQVHHPVIEELVELLKEKSRAHRQLLNVSLN